MKHHKGKECKRITGDLAELLKWLDKSSKELKATSAYLLECQVEVNKQLFKDNYRNGVKDRAEILKHTTMLNGTLAAAWRIRHEFLKLEIARLPERYHKIAWSLVRHVYFKLLGNCQLVDPIFNDMIFLGKHAEFETISEYNRGKLQGICISSLEVQ